MKKHEQESPTCGEQISNYRTYFWARNVEGTFQCYSNMQPGEIIENGKKSNGRTCPVLYYFPVSLIKFHLGNSTASILSIHR